MEALHEREAYDFTDEPQAIILEDGQSVADPMGEITSDYLSKIFGDILTVDDEAGTRTVEDVIQEAEAFLMSPMVQEILVGVDRLTAMYAEFCRQHNHNQEGKDLKNSIDDESKFLEDEEDDGHGHVRMGGKGPIRGLNIRNAGRNKETAVPDRSLMSLILKYFVSVKKLAR